MRQLRALPDTVDDALYLHPRAFSRRELIALSNEHDFRSALASGKITRLVPNCYVATEHAESFEARADAALTWAGPGAALTGPSACFAWTLIDEPPRTIDMVVAPDKRLSPPSWLRIKRAPWAAGSSTTRDFTAVPPAIAIADGYAALTEEERVDAVFGGIARGIVTARELRQALVDLPRIRARRSLTSRIEAAERGAESWLEEVGLREVFSTREFAYFTRQHRLVCRGRTYRLDMFDPFSRTAVELDSHAWHSGDKQRQRDIQRDAELATMGILTLRLSTHDLIQSQEWCRDIVRQAVALRRRSL